MCLSVHSMCSIHPSSCLFFHPAIQPILTFVWKCVLYSGWLVQSRGLTPFYPICQTTPFLSLKLLKAKRNDLCFVCLSFSVIFLFILFLFTLLSQVDWYSGENYPFLERERERERERKRERERESVYWKRKFQVSQCAPHCAQTQMTCSAVVLQ